MSTVLVTGATGFVGQAITQRLLKAGYEVRALSRRNELPSQISKAELIRADLTTLTQEQASEFLAGVDAVVHCAGELTQLSNMRALHVDATRTLVTAAAGSVATWVQLSSVGALGRHAGGVVDEKHQGSPVGEYETTKAASDKVVWQTLEETSTRCVILKPTIVFHEHMPNNSLRRMLEVATRLPVVVLPDRHAIANYVYRDDVALAVECALEVGASDSFIISDSVLLSQFLTEALSGAGVSKTAHGLPGPLGKAIHRLARIGMAKRGLRVVAAMTNRSSYSSDKARLELGWTPQVGWRTGIRRAAASWGMDGTSDD